MPATNVVKLPAAIAVSTIFFVGPEWAGLPLGFAEVFFDCSINNSLDV
jgi:hypothetical protein